MKALKPVIMSMNRQTAKSLLSSIDKYDAAKVLVERAIDPKKPSVVKSHSKNRVKLDDAYAEVVHHWKDFKRDIGHEVLNGADENGVANHEHDDKWMEKFVEAYCDLAEKSDDALEALENGSKDNTEEEEKFKEDETNKNLRLLGDKQVQLESLGACISSSINKLSTEISLLSDGSCSEAKINAYKMDLYTIETKIDEKYLDLSNLCASFLSDKLLEEHRLSKKNFVSEEKAKIDSLNCLLNKKIIDSSPSSSTFHSSKKEQSYLKKVDPPTFKGDIVGYADFVRKWKAVVSKAGLSEEGELDRLKDHVPTQAAKALYGESTMLGAWNVLNRLYGDKDLVANKLKVQLKSIKAKGKREQDIVIDLVTEVNNIVLRMKALDMEKLLKVDNDFLSAIYRALPSPVQDKWLEFDKSTYSTKWDAFTVFLEKSREKALQSKALISTYEDENEDVQVSTCKKCGLSGHKEKNCRSAKINQMQAGKGGDDDSDRKKAKSRKQEKEECGKCPLCGSYHTFIRRRDKEEWPSDRLFVCEKYKKLSVRDKADALEKYKCCPKCTSWRHNKKDECPSNAKCNKLVNGKPCGGEHSSTVCGSGSAYCGSARASKLNSVSSSDTSLDSDSAPDVDAIALNLFQDVNVLGCSPARTCWDNGSNRALITHKYAKAHKLRPQEISFKLDVPGHNGDVQQGVLYEFTLVDNNGHKRKIWAYGIEKIMDNPDPVDLSPVRKLFPHLPREVFLPLDDKPVDLLIGTNFFQLHPDGGQGRDASGDLKALQSNFGHGWVIGGTHPSIKTCPAVLTKEAFNIARVNKLSVAPDDIASFWEGRCLSS